MSKPLYHSYGANSTKNSFLNYKLMGHIPGCLPPISRTKGGFISQECAVQLNYTNMFNSIPRNDSNYLKLGLRSGNPNTVSIWKGNQIYK